MATRRPRFKPTAILKQRRVPVTTEPKVEAVPSIAENQSETEAATIEEEPMVDTSLTTPIKKEKPPDNEIEVPATVKKEEEIKKVPSRRIKPSVCIPVRKKKVNVDQQKDLKVEKDDDKSASEVSDKKSSNSSDILFSQPAIQKENIENIHKNVDDNFKSPFLSPSVQSSQQQKRIIESYNAAMSSPSHDSQHKETLNNNDEFTKNSALSPIKVRQRIRPTPCFSNRRNSMQGNLSESEDETTRRQRHLSTSSNHSNYNFPSNNVTKSVPHDLGTRNRTESVCSNISDVTSTYKEISYSKPKRAVRSDEILRIINAKREFQLKFNGKTPDKQRLTMFDMIYYNPVTNPLKNPALKPSEIKSRRSSVMSSASSVHSVGNKSVASSVNAKVPSLSGSYRSTESVKNEEVKAEVAMPVPQIKLGPNGEIILDEKSLVIETTGDKEARETLANADIVYDDEFSGTSGFYKRHKRTRDWQASETIKFYRCLHTIGTDFSLMLSLFPNRTRKDLKLKFKKEERLNLHLINKALMHPKQFNIEDLQIEFDKEEEELQRKKTEWEETKQKRIKERKESMKLLRKKTRRSRFSEALQLLNEGDIYDGEFVIPPKRRTRTKLSMEEPVFDDDQYILSTNDSPNNAPEPEYFSTANKVLPSFQENFGSPRPSPRHISYDTISQPTPFHNDTKMDPSKEVCKPLNADNSSTPTQNQSAYQADDILNMEIIFEAANSREESNELEPIDNDRQAVNVNPLTADDHEMVDMDIDDSCNLSKNSVGSDTILEVVVDKNEMFSNHETRFEIVNNQIIQVKTNAPGHGQTNNFYDQNYGDREFNSVEQSHFEYEKDAADSKDFNKMIKVLKNDDDFIVDNEIMVDNETEDDTMAEDDFLPEDDIFEDNISEDEDRKDIINKCLTENETDENQECCVEEEEDPSEEIDDGNKIIKNEQNVDEEEEKDDSDEDDDDSIIPNSLVVIARQDPNDASKLIHEVFVISPETGQRSEIPLDLPANIIESLRQSLLDD